MFINNYIVFGGQSWRETGRRRTGNWRKVECTQLNSERNGHYLQFSEGRAQQHTSDKVAGFFFGQTSSSELNLNFLRQKRKLTVEPPASLVRVLVTRPNVQGVVWRPFLEVSLLERFIDIF